MAKSKSRVGRAAIAGMLGVENADQAVDDLTASSIEHGPRGIPEMREGGHPVRDRAESGVARADNALVLDPRRVVQRGRYVRPFTDDHRFQELLSAIEEAGRTIHVPILVRVEGPPGDVEYVLVDGTHRLEAALRLGISLPAINLGRITPDRAFAIQAMANEVRATMHVVDQAAYVLVLENQGLSRESVQRTTGFSAGRVSELASLGRLLATIEESDLIRARRAHSVTHRALRALKTAAADDHAFRRGVMTLVTAWETTDSIDANGAGDFEDARVVAFRPDGTFMPAGPQVDIGALGYQLASAFMPRRSRRGRKPLAAGGVSFDSAQNSRGTSVTFRMAWRARAIRQDPELFLERVHDAIQLIAAQATAQYEAATTQQPGQRAGQSVSKKSAATRVEADREVTDLVMPEWENPMPLPSSQRGADDLSAAIDPRLLAGLSLPMLADRLKRGSSELYRRLEKQVSDAEQQAENTRKRVRGVIDADEADKREGKSRAR